VSPATKKKYAVADLPALHGLCRKNDSIDSTSRNPGNPALLAEHFLLRIEIEKPVQDLVSASYQLFVIMRIMNLFLLQNNVL